MKVALLADLFELVEPNASSDLSILTFELADALREFARDVGGLSVDLIARRRSWQGLPLLSIDLAELPELKDASLDRFARQEAAYTQLVLSGALSDYDLIHCLAPIVAPLQLLAAMGRPIVQTLVTDSAHPSRRLVPVLINEKRIRRIAATSSIAQENNLLCINPAVDLNRFCVSETNKGSYLLWIKDDDRRKQQTAKQIARGLGLPLRTDLAADPVEVLQKATVLLSLAETPSPVGHQWALRALACGKAVAGWKGGGLDELLEPLGTETLVTQGDVGSLIERIGKLKDTPVVTSSRRQLVLALNGRRSIIQQYLECYRLLLGLR
jgi:hypothetical protein